MKKIIKIAVLVIIALIIIWTFGLLWSNSQPKDVFYETEKAEFADIEKTTIATGKIEPRNEIQVKPQISGIITELYKEAGQPVAKDEVIAKVKVIPEMGELNNAESRVRVAKISLSQVEAEYKRVKNLYEDKLVSAHDFEEAETSYNRAKEELAAAEDNLDIVKTGISRNAKNNTNTLIRSTITGLILDIPVKVGNTVTLSNTFNDGTTIATVADMGDLIFKGKIDETEVGRIREGMPVIITLGALQDLKFDAKLEYISPKGVEENGANQFEIKAAMTVPDTVTIRSGYSANAEIVLQRKPKVLCVPESTLEFSGDSTFVYVLTDSLPVQKFERKAVETGISDGIKIQIVNGLNEGDIVRGNQKNEE